MTHRHNWIRVGGPPDEPWDSNVYLACACGKKKTYPCGDLRGSLSEMGRWPTSCAKPIGHSGPHRGNGFEWENAA